MSYFNNCLEFEENNKNLDKIILEQKPKILVLSDKYLFYIFRSPKLFLAKQ